MSRPGINDLAAFVAVATHRSFRRAADELGTAPSTLSHAMRALEARMGVRLLNRTTRSVAPTEAGFQFLARLQPALAALDEAIASVADFRGRVAGTVRINAPRLAASLLVRAVLPRLAAGFPDVVVDLVVQGQLIDIVAAGFDAGMRLVDSVPRDMIAVPLGAPVRFVCVASPDYLARAGTPGSPEELRGHRCLGHRLPGGRLYRWEFMRAGHALTIETAGAHVLDDEELMVEAAIRGLGIAYVASPAAEAALAAGNLCEILPAWMHPPERLALYYPGHRAVPPALRALIDVVRELDHAGSDH
jgi:DNA-binding transcriptional LysR family regulator